MSNLVRFFGWRGVIIAYFLFSFQVVRADDVEVRYFPQVARGQGEDSIYIETIFVLSNSGATATTVEFQAETPKLKPLSSVTLEAGETKVLKLSGVELVFGWVGVAGDPSVAISAFLVTRPSPDSPDQLSQTTLLPIKAASKVIIPVFRNSEDGNVGPAVENTGVAIALPSRNGFSATLFDSSGVPVASVEVPPFRSHLSAFVTELFPDLPPDFTTGSLVVQGHPEETPRTLAVTALYTSGTKFWTAAVKSVDISVEFLVGFNEPPDAQTVEEMAIQYGFEVMDSRDGGNRILVMCLDAVAEAVSRDPRVSYVDPNMIVFPAN